MKRENLRNLVLLAAIVLIAVFGCKWATEKSPNEQPDDKKPQETPKWQRTSDILAALEPNLDEWARLAPPVKLVRQPYLQGKMVLVYRRAEGVNELAAGDVVELGELYAETVEAAQTLLQIDCYEIRRGIYTVTGTDDQKIGIPAFVSQCETNLIDLTLPAVIYRKTFENTKLTEEISSRDIDWDEIKKNNKVVASEPGSVKDFV
jgi:hypothetical protein